MKKTRKATDDCLICIKNRATKTNSHFVPVCLLKNSVGKRYYEHSHNFNITTRKVDEYIGRDNPKGFKEDSKKSIELKTNHYTGNYFFCPECETHLSKIEGDICGVFTGIKDFAQKNPNRITALTDSKIVRLNEKVSFDQFMAFTYSVIWRASLQLEYFDNNPIFYKSESEDIRKALWEWMYNSKNDRLKNLTHRYSLAIFHPENQEDLTNNDYFALGISQIKVFCIFEFMFFLFKTSNPKQNFEPQRLIKHESNIKINLVDKDLWISWLNRNRETLILQEDRQRK